MKLTWTDYPEYYDDKMDSISLEIPAPPLKNHIFIEGDNYPVLKKLSPLYSIASIKPSFEIAEILNLSLLSHV